MVKVYCVVAYDFYYPEPNNVRKCFLNLEDAVAYRNQIAYEDPDGYGQRDYYDILEYEAE